MKSTVFGERIKTLRISLGKSQKEFAEFIGIPQPSMSAYENGKNSPTIEVLINIADKCNVSIDWLCGRQEEVSLSDLSDVASFLYKLMEINEIGCEIAVHDRMENGLDIEKDGETDDRNRWWTRLTFYGNDPRFKYNGDLCQIITKMNNNVIDLKSYAVSRESYEREKEAEICSYSLPLTQKKYDSLSRDERIKRHIDYLKNNDYF